MTQSTVALEDLALGHYLTLIKPDESELRFQNFWIGETAIWQDTGWVGSSKQSHVFLPFGFSGISVNRQGDNVDAALVFPNTGIARGFLDEAVTQRWTAVIRVCLIDNLTDSQDPPTMLHRYVGQSASGTWTDTELGLRLNSILDAVGGEVPARALMQRMVGDIPATGRIALL